MCQYQMIPVTPWASSFEAPVHRDTCFSSFKPRMDQATTTDITQVSLDHLRSQGAQVKDQHRTVWCSAGQQIAASQQTKPKDTESMAVKGQGFFHCRRYPFSRAAGQFSVYSLPFTLCWSRPSICITEQIPTQWQCLSGRKERWCHSQPTPDDAKFRWSLPFVTVGWLEENALKKIFLDLEHSHWSCLYCWFYIALICLVIVLLLLIIVECYMVLICTNMVLLCIGIF